MQDEEVRPGQRVRDAITNEIGVVRSGPTDGRWRVQADGHDHYRFASQLTLERQAPDQTDPSDRPAGFVVKAPGHGYFVRSRTTPGAWWFVTGDSCSCPSTTTLCWHVRRTYEFEKPEPIRITCEGSGHPPCRVTTDPATFSTNGGMLHGMCAMCGQFVPIPLGHDINVMPPHERNDVLAMIERGDFG